MNEVQSHAAQIKKGDVRALAKGITLVESQRPEDQPKAEELLKQLLPEIGKSLRIGITGTPGVGKSTFIEALGLEIIASGKKVGVLTIDPSSPTRGGSILGDKTRMQKLSTQPAAYIRPSPNQGQLGGVAPKTHEVSFLLEAAGYDVILIETVGVGQSDDVVSSLSDLTVLLTMPGTGDELQGMKRGAMELSDLIIVNKADGELLEAAARSKDQLEGALGLYSSSNHPVFLASALNSTGIRPIWDYLQEVAQNRSAEINQSRISNQLDLLEKELHWAFQYALKNRPALQKALQNAQDNSKSCYILPRIEAKQILEQVLLD